MTTAATAAALEAERDFLLRSIADLEAEHRAGELADERFRELRDEYTVQAATVLKALEQLSGAAPAPSAPPTKTGGGRPAWVIAAVVVTVAVSGLLLARALGERGPGQTITGNAQTATADLATLERQARQRPGDARAQSEYAQALLGADRAADALRAFDAAARLDPADPEPKAYAGWVVFLAGLTDEALVRIDAAIAIDPAYPDARFFRGMVLLQGRNDRVGALTELREYLRTGAPGPDRDRVVRLVEELEASRQGPPTTAPAPAG